MAGPITLLSLANLATSSHPSGSRRPSALDEDGRKQLELDDAEEEELKNMEEEDARYRHILRRSTAVDFDDGVKADHEAGRARDGLTGGVEGKRPSWRDGVELSDLHTQPRLSYQEGNQTERRKSSGIDAAPSLNGRNGLERFLASHSGALSRISGLILGAKEKQRDPTATEANRIEPKYRWTPILSGLIQPFSILLEIPGLTEHWYVKHYDDVPTTYQPNPALLDVGLAFSMLCGVIANIALISRFTERRVYVNTLICIVMLSLHDIINIVIVTIFGIIHSDNDGFDYSEAFWLCVCSTASSFFTNVTLIIDFYRTKDFRRSGSGLTPKQRKLVIIVMVLLVYIAVGALCFNFLLPEIPFQSALYFTVVSIETIGFGDISPYTLGARIFIFFYVPVGILNLAVAVGTARDTLVESWSAAYRRRRHKVVTNHRERKRQRKEEAIRVEALARTLTGWRKRGVRSSNESVSEDDVREGNRGGNESITSNGVEASRLRAELAEQSASNEESYFEFQQRMAHEEKIENWIKFAFASGLFVVFWVVGATIFARTEEWDWFTGFYFCFVTFTTIGYGDVTPVSPAGRAFFVIWAMLGVATVTLLIAVLTEVYATKYRAALLRRGAQRAVAAVSRSNKDGQTAEAKEADKGIERLPYEVVDLLKGWHAHVKHVSNTRQGALDYTKSEEFTGLLQDFMDKQGMGDAEKREMLGDAEGRKQLFWLAYDEAVDRLITQAERAIQQHERVKRNTEQLASMPLLPHEGLSPTGAVYIGGRGLTRVVTRMASANKPVIHTSNVDVRSRPFGETAEHAAFWGSQPDLTYQMESLPLSPANDRRRSGV